MGLSFTCPGMEEVIEWKSQAPALPCSKLQLLSAALPHLVMQTEELMQPPSTHSRNCRMYGTEDCNLIEPICPLFNDFIDNHSRKLINA